MRINNVTFEQKWCREKVIPPRNKTEVLYLFSQSRTLNFQVDGLNPPNHWQLENDGVIKIALNRWFYRGIEKISNW
jgi:hypothetical protein